MNISKILFFYYVYIYFEIIPKCYKSSFGNVLFFKSNLFLLLHGFSDTIPCHSPGKEHIRMRTCMYIKTRKAGVNKATMLTPVTSSWSDPRWRSHVRQAKSTAGNGGGGRTGFRRGGTTTAVAAASMYVHTARNFVVLRAEKPKLRNRMSATLSTRLQYSAYTFRLPVIL